MVYGKLENEFEDIYLVNNKGFFQIYRREDGKGKESEFVLFMSNNEKSHKKCFQVSISISDENTLNFPKKFKLIELNKTLNIQFETCVF